MAEEKNLLDYDGLKRYHKKIQTYIAKQVDGLSRLSYVIVDEWPTKLSDIDKYTIYLVKNIEKGENNFYDEYMYVGPTTTPGAQYDPRFWEKIGTTQADVDAKADSTDVIRGFKAEYSTSNIRVYTYNDAGLQDENKLGARIVLQCATSSTGVDQDGNEYEAGNAGLMSPAMVRKLAGAAQQGFDSDKWVQYVTNTDGETVPVYNRTLLALNNKVDELAVTGASFDFGSESGVMELEMLGMDGEVMWSAPLPIANGVVPGILSADSYASFSAKYDKPSDGIPRADLTADVQTSLGKADSIPDKAVFTDRSVEGVQYHYKPAEDEHELLDANEGQTNNNRVIQKIKRDASGHVVGIEATQLSFGNLSGKASDAQVSGADKWNAKYDKPADGIPKTDLSEAVQTSLGKADSIPSGAVFTDRSVTAAQYHYTPVEDEHEVLDPNAGQTNNNQVIQKIKRDDRGHVVGIEAAQLSLSNISGGPELSARVTNLESNVNGSVTQAISAALNTAKSYTDTKVAGVEQDIADAELAFATVKNNHEQRIKTLEDNFSSFRTITFEEIDALFEDIPTGGGDTDDDAIDFIANCDAMATITDYGNVYYDENRIHLNAGDTIHVECSHEYGITLLRDSSTPGKLELAISPSNEAQYHQSLVYTATEDMDVYVALKSEQQSPCHVYVERA